MKKTFFFLLGMLMITSASAAEYQYVPLVREGVKWVEYYNNTIDNTQSVTIYHFSGNIVIGGNVYSILYAISKNSNFTQEDVTIAYVREQDKQIYAIPVNAVIDECILSNEDIGEFQIYNFNDIISPYLIDESFMTPISIEQMLFGENCVNIFILGNSKRIAEGIGCLDNVFYNPWPITPPDGSHTSLAWYEDNGEIIYKGEDYNAAVELLLTTGITKTNGVKQKSSVRYYNLAGVESSEPQPGMNIRVTTYTDGTRHTEKAVR